MLEATTGSEQWDVLFSGALDTEQRTLQAPIRTAGAAKQSLVVAKRMRSIGGEPSDFKGMSSEHFRGVIDTFVSRDVRGIVGVVVSNNANLYLARHASIIEAECVCVKSNAQKA
jgi:hypothetical protein